MNKIKIYTDGACSNNPGPGGWGVVFTGNKKLKVLSGYDICTTNNRMELIAVAKAFRYVYKHFKEYKNKEIVLYSDSAYVVNAINNKWLFSWRKNNWKTSKGLPVKNADLWLKYLKYNTLLHKKHISIKLIKVKGHSGDTYNEYVDGVAKEQVNIAREHLVDNKEVE